MAKIAEISIKIVIRIVNNKYIIEGTREGGS